MNRRSLIRSIPEIAFLLLFGGGLALGGGAALAGIPKLLDALTPDMSAQAGEKAAETPDTGEAPGPSAHGVVRLVVPGFTESRFTPQVLYPVTAQPKPGWLVEAMREARSGPPPALRGTRPVIAICIDDLGEDLAGTDKAMALPKEVALSFLPFADATPFLAEATARSGHLVLAHVPMQALNGADPGPMGLKPGMTAAEIGGRLAWNLARVPGAAGINNHEGSLFTADAKALAPVMVMLRARHLFFFDSRTSAQTEGAKTAQAAGVMAAERDVFLDDDPNPPAVRAELDRLAEAAKRNGAAIAIGHPHDVTLRLLANWLAEDHGVTLVPLDEAIRRKAARDYALAASPSP
jgi:hypothetical protein